MTVHVIKVYYGRLRKYREGKRKKSTCSSAPWRKSVLTANIVSKFEIVLNSEVYPFLLMPGI